MSRRQLDLFYRPKKRKKKKRIVSMLSMKDARLMQRVAKKIGEKRPGKIWKSQQGNYCFYLYDK